MSASPWATLEPRRAQRDEERGGAKQQRDQEVVLGVDHRCQRLGGKRTARGEGCELFEARAVRHYGSRG